jgi:transcriptional regulator with XRE-family HTH domain
MSAKIKPTLVDRAAGIKIKILAALWDICDARHMSPAELAKATGATLADIEAVAAGTGPVKPLIDAMHAHQLDFSNLVDGDYLAQRLAKGRAAMGLSVTEAAEEADISTAAINDLENGAGELANLFPLLAIIAPRVGCRKTKLRSWGKRDTFDSDTRVTPPEFLNAIYQGFGPIDVDPCGHEKSLVIAADRIMLSDGRDGLNEDWRGGVVFVNPPFSSQVKWLEYSHNQWAKGNAKTILCLVPVRTCNNLFHHSLYKDTDFFMIKGRLRFGDVDGRWESTKFSLMVVMFGATRQQKAAFSNLVEGKWGRFFELAELSLAEPVSVMGHGSVRTMSCVAAYKGYAVHCGAVGSN